MDNLRLEVVLKVLWLCLTLQLMDNLDFPNAVKEIGQAAKYLKETGAPKVGITGE